MILSRPAQHLSRALASALSSHGPPSRIASHAALVTYVSTIRRVRGPRDEAIRYYSRASRYLQNDNNQIKPQYWASQMRKTQYSDSELQSWKEEFTNLSGYSLPDLALWRRAFDLVDTDKDGYISQADLQKNPNFTIERVKLFREYDLDRNNLIDFGEFVEAMFNVDWMGLRDDFEGFDTVDIQLEFENYGINRNDPADAGKKVITLAGVKRLMNAHDFTVITDVDANRLLSFMDKNGDGVIDFDDFRQWLFPHIYRT